MKLPKNEKVDQMWLMYTYSKIQILDQRYKLNEVLEVPWESMSFLHEEVIERKYIGNIYT